MIWSALQLGDKHRITTPVNWKVGDDVIVHPGVSNDEAKTLFPEHVTNELPSFEALLGDLCQDLIFVIVVQNPFPLYENILSNSSHT